MKEISILIFITMIFVCCNSASDKTNSIAIVKQSEKLKGQKFFEYDEIDYYFSRYGDMDVVDLHNNRSKSEIDSFKIGVILDDIPKDISDLSFIGKLESLGYKKSFVNKMKFDEIDQIFMEKPVKQMLAMSCIDIYNDVLIFKKQKKVIGIAKVCLGCLAHQITGTTANTQGFGQDGEYERLGKLLGK